jgi:hypothetical protein
LLLPLIGLKATGVNSLLWSTFEESRLIGVLAVLVKGPAIAVEVFGIDPMTRLEGVIVSGPFSWK